MILKRADFNGLHLLDGSSETIRIAAGPDHSSTIDIDLQDTRASEVFEDVDFAGSFASGSSFSGTIISVEKADFNADGHVDLIYHANANLIVRLGDGTGAFTTTSTYATGATTAGDSLNVADLNNDGHLDIVSTNSGASTVSILLGNGSGGFSYAQTLTVTQGISTEIEDFNSDGIKDLVMGRLGGVVEVYLGTGTGAFNLGVTILASSSGGSILGLETGDFNEDGIMDFIAGGNSDNFGTLYLGNGFGSFVAASSFTTFGLVSLSSGDINDDGRLDFISTAYGTGSSYVYLGDGEGHFSFRNTLSGIESVNGARGELADVDNDGHLDFIASTGENLAIKYYFGDGEGNFNRRATITTSTEIYDITLTDLNEDGILDVVGAFSGASGAQAWIANASTGSGLEEMNVLNSFQSRKMLEIIDTALESLVSQRSELSAAYEGLESRFALSQTLQEAALSALSSTQDTDIALETAELVKQQILQQMQIAVLSQANLQMQTVLSLLAPLGA